MNVCTSCRAGKGTIYDMMQQAVNPPPYVNASLLFRRHADGIERASVLAASVRKRIVGGDCVLLAFV